MQVSARLLHSILNNRTFYWAYALKTALFEIFVGRMPKLTLKTHNFFEYYRVNYVKKSLMAPISNKKYIEQLNFNAITNERLFS